VISRCEKLITAGRYFVAWTDTYVGSHGSAQEFLNDQIREIKQAWIREQCGKVTFAAHASDITPGNAPAGIVCAEYSVTAAADDEVKHAEGITCAWPVEHRGWTIEICVLEASDEYRPFLGQKPMTSFDAVVRDLFASARLSSPVTAAHDEIMTWSKDDVFACFGPAIWSPVGRATGSNAKIVRNG
jgi:hypothetical protein